MNETLTEFETVPFHLRSRGRRQKFHYRRQRGSCIMVTLMNNGSRLAVEWNKMMAQWTCPLSTHLAGTTSEPYVFHISTSCRRTDEPVSHDQNLHVDFPFVFLPDPLYPPTVTWRHLPNAIDSASKFGWVGTYMFNGGTFWMQSFSDVQPAVDTSPRSHLTHTIPDYFQWYRLWITHIDVHFLASSSISHRDRRRSRIFTGPQLWGYSESAVDALPSFLKVLFAWSTYTNDEPWYDGT